MKEKIEKSSLAWAVRRPMCVCLSSSLSLLFSLLIPSCSFFQGGSFSSIRTVISIWTDRTGAEEKSEGFIFSTCRGGFLVSFFRHSRARVPHSPGFY
jgi:hypothetical protein